MLNWLETLTPPNTLSNPLLTAYVLLDIFIIVVLARLLGNLFTRIKQPRVVGEILAGIILGPTLLGENLSLFITPQPVRPILAAIATLGLILFMFIAGIEYDIKTVTGRSRQAGLLALLSVAFPALLGFPLAQAMNQPTYIGTNSSLLPFSLLLGAMLTVTAFPVMAHILMERNELNTPLGALAVATAAFVSVLMFIYIAFAQAVAEASGFGALVIKVSFMALFGIASWWGVRSALRRIITGSLSGNHMALIFAGLVLYGLIADRLGLNALVGGFIWGIILPENPDLRTAVAGKVRDVTLILFLPLFFALAGFSTDLKLLTAEILPIALLVLLVAVAGKFIAVVPARVLGLSWGQVGALGALFNTRGLLVLVVGLIGLQLQIFTERTFVIAVLVALVTNLMTLPLLNFFSPQTK